MIVDGVRRELRRRGRRRNKRVLDVIGALDDEARREVQGMHALFFSRPTG